MKEKKFIIKLSLFQSILLIYLIIFSAHLDIYAQEVYTNLKDPKQVQCFTEVTSSLVCQCGCNQVLSTCSHIDCPFAIPARLFIESRIKSGDTSNQIINGFNKGFGVKIVEDAYVKNLKQKGQKDFIEKLIGGYGPKVLAQHSIWIPIIFLTIASIISGFVISYWYKSNRK